MEYVISLDQQLLTWFNAGGSPFLDHLVGVLTAGALWIPLYLALFYLVLKNNEAMSQIMTTILFSLLAVLLAGGVDDLLIKPLVGRLRPCDAPAMFGIVRPVADISARGYSFFSAHAANTMAVAVFFSWLIRSRLLSVFLVSWSLLNGWTRLYLGVHYPSDVMCGWLWGAMAGSLCYLLFRKVFFKFSPQLHYISTQYTSTGYNRTDVDAVAAVLTILLLVSTLYAVATPII